ncbi:PaaI family thioesterase [Effusibacillus dendaii]|uniref:PaaI family thioesterase n=1 Tax=Effusibacillus dendaii TaxID=2743772 RepID=UPI00190B298F|nr:PaaI family thioesterase [Effusibacillus dendaii]
MDRPGKGDKTELNKEQFLRLVEAAYDKSELKMESIFLFHLFGFQFSYNDQEKTCSIECPVSEPMLNPAGIVHGGVFTLLTDSSMGHLLMHDKQASYVSLELKTSYFNAAHTGKIKATARYMRDGYRVVFLESTVVNEGGELLCKTTGTFYRAEKKGQLS